MAAAPPLDSVLGTAPRLAAEGRLLEALRQVQQALTGAPTDPRGWLLLGQLALQLKDLRLAMEAAQVAERLLPHTARVHYLKGRVLRARGEDDAAAACYERAVVLAPEDADAWTSLGIVRRALGRDAEAEAAYRRALAAAPDHAPARHNLDNLLAARGAEAEDRAAVDAARAQLLDGIERRLSLARRLSEQGKPVEAMELITQALELAPRSARVLVDAVRLSAELGYAESALDYCDRFLELEPEAAGILDSARRIAGVAGLAERAQRYTLRLQALRPSPALEISAALSLPAIQSSRASIRGSRERYALALQALRKRQLRSVDPFAAVNASFFLAYHGECDRDLQRHLAELYTEATPSLRYVAADLRAGGRRRTRAGERIRVGFISKFLHFHSIGKTTRGLIEELDRDRFEAIAICVKPGPDDATSQRIRARADRWIELDGAVDGAGSLDEARRRLEELQLDVLFYQDIGMEPFTYFLAFSRLAPVQCVSFGHPNTAGIPEIDYFVSNDEYETEESPGHYSERLFLLRNLPTLAYYYRPARPLAPLDRSEIGLPGDATLYLCPQTLFKLHPDQDRLFAGILGRDPRAHLVLIAGAISQWTRELKARMRSAMPELMERVSFLPLMSHARFLRLLAAGDVMLDPVHFNGQNSSLEAFAVDLPIVTLPGRFQRGRHTLAMYRAMGIDDGVARDEADYIDLAVALGTDPARRARVRERIHAASPVLYENRRVIREFERFFTEATAALRQQD